MNDKFRFQLDRSPRKFVCPGCNQRKLVRYIDATTKEYLPEEFGRCDRQDHCGYHINPYTAGFEKNKQVEQSARPKATNIPQPKYYIPESILNATLKQYEVNSFIRNLMKLVPIQEIEKAISLYRIGTVSKGARAGSVTFPFIDIVGNIRAIQVKLFDETNHTRRNGTDFIHSILFRYYHSMNKPLPLWLNDYLKNEKYVSCLFGEHLLTRYRTNPVALVEAPKTAIIGTLYYGFPDNPCNFLWLAVYNKSSLTVDRCQALKGRKVVLFPDLGAFTDWQSKEKDLINEISGAWFSTSDILEREANEIERQAGCDLADFLSRFDWRKFRENIKS